MSWCITFLQVLSPECSEFEDEISIQDVMLPSPPKLPRVAMPLQDQSMNVRCVSAVIRCNSLCTCVLHTYSGEMKALMSAFDTGLSNAVKV